MTRCSLSFLGAWCVGWNSVALLVVGVLGTPSLFTYLEVRWLFVGEAPTGLTPSLQIRVTA